MTSSKATASERALRSDRPPHGRRGALDAGARLASASALAAALIVPFLACRERDRSAAVEWPGTDAEADAPAAGGTAIFALLRDIESFNPCFASVTYTSDVLRRLFVPLLIEQPDFQEHPPSMAPGLAASYEWSPDRLRLTIRLRPGLEWSDGSPITARDVAFTHEALTSDDVAWGSRSVKERIKSVRALDDLTTEFEFSVDVPTNLLDAVEGSVFPEHAFGKVPFREWKDHDFSRDLVCSGPFRLGSYKPGQEIVLERNARYFERGKPYLDRVIFRIIPDQSRMIEELLHGNLDAMEAVPPPDVDRVRASRDLEIREYANRQIDYIAWNELDPEAFGKLRKQLDGSGRAPTMDDLTRVREESPHALFGDAEIRKALSLAIDRRDLVDSLWLGFGDVPRSPLHSSLWACDRSLPPYAYDPAAARDVLARRGFSDTDGDGVLDRQERPFEFTLMTSVENKLRLGVAAKVKDQLAKIGVRMDLEVLEDGALRSRRSQEKRFDACLGAWRVATKAEVRSSYHSRKALGGQNFACYFNRAVDGLIEEVEKVADVREAMDRWRELQRTIRADEPYTLLYEPHRVNGVHRRLHGVQMNAIETFFRLEDWWILPAARRTG